MSWTIMVSTLVFITFLCWNQFGSQILVWICRFSKFPIWNVQILSNDKITKIKVVDINELNNFGIHHFLCWNHFESQILVRTCHFLTFQNLKGSNLVKWQDDQNKSCRSWWVEQLLYSSLLHLKSFRVWKFGLNLSNFKF